jgi:hypothetical protein
MQRLRLVAAKLLCNQGVEVMSGPTKIPKIFHFNFGLKPQREPFHLMHYLCLESCLRVNRPEKIFFFYCHKPYGRYWELISEKLELIPVEPVPEVSAFNYADPYIRDNFTYAHHSDFLRLKYLNEFGGVYADIDTLFVRPIPRRLFDQSFVMGHEAPVFDEKQGEAVPSLCNALMMAEKRSVFGTEYFARMPLEFNGSWSNHSCGLAWRLSQELPESIHVEPQTSFFKYSWMPADIDQMFRGLDPVIEGVYSLHLWSHLWWSRTRKDFSTFHAGRLTERYIRNAASTYALAARPFLPPAKRSFFSFRTRDSASTIQAVEKGSQ